MAYTTPFTAVAGNVILASGWNTSGRDNIEYLKGRAGTIAFQAGATFAAGIAAAGIVSALDDKVWSQSVTAGPSEIGFRGQRSGSDAQAIKYQWVNQASTDGWEAIMPASLTTLQLNQVGVGVALELESGASGLAQFSRLVRSTKASITSLGATSYLSAQVQASAPTGVPGIGLTKTDSSTGLLLYHNGLGSGADILRGRGSNNGDWIFFSTGYMGAGTGLDADTVDSLNPGNASGNIAVSNGTKCVGLNADLLDGLNVGHSASDIPWSEAGVLNTGLRSEFADKILAGGLGHVIVGNSSNQVPISNGTVNANLNAQLLNGNAASAFALLSGATFSGAVSATQYIATTNGGFRFNASNEFFYPPNSGEIGWATGGTQRFRQTDTLAIFATPGTYVTSWTAVSDRRLKADIQIIGGALGRLKRLFPITYVPSAAGVAEGMTRGKRSPGFIAQDVSEVFPELVDTRRGRDVGEHYLTVNEIGLIPYLVEALVALSGQVDTISARLAA